MNTANLCHDVFQRRRITSLQEARPLLQQSIQLVEEVTPLLKELREGGLVANVEALTSTAAAAAADIQKLQVRGEQDTSVNTGWQSKAVHSQLDLQSA